MAISVKHLAATALLILCLGSVRAQPPPPHGPPPHSLNPILWCIVPHSDGSVTACFGYENFDGRDFDLDDGPWNNLYICNKPHSMPLAKFIMPRRVHGRDGITSGFPNCTFSITIPNGCVADWSLCGKRAHADKKAPLCPNPDSVPPTFGQCPGTVTVNADPTKSTATLTLNAAATDNGGGPVTISNTLTGDHGLSPYKLTTTFPLDTTTFNFVATDSGGNSATCPTSVTVLDNQPPVINVRYSTIDCNCDVDQSYCTLPAGQVAASATDNDNRGVSITNDYGLSPGGPDGTGPYYIGDTTVTFTAKDHTGNKASKATVVKTHDTQPPKMNNVPTTASGTLPATCAQPPCTASVAITASSIPDNSHLPVSVKITSVTPAVPVAGPPFTYTATFPYGVSSVTWQATDASGNVATATTTVTVGDVNAPALQCPPDITNQAADSNSNTWAGALQIVSASDNSGSFTWIAGPIIQRTFVMGVNTVVFQAKDAANNVGSCTTHVTVLDTQPPVITCPPAITADAQTGGATYNLVYDPAGSTSPFSAHATDNVGVVSMSNSCNGPSTIQFGVGDSSAASDGVNCIYQIGTKTVTWTATDQAGNSKSCSTVVTITDHQAPSFGNPSPCGTTRDGGSAGSGNYYASVQLSVAPTAYVQLVNPNSQVTCTWSAVWPQGLAVPTVAIDDVTADSATSGTGCSIDQNWAAGLTPVTFTAADEFGNIGTCTITVRVSDTTLPLLSCDGVKALTCDSGATTYHWVGGATGTDNVGVTQVSYSIVGGASASIQAGSVSLSLDLPCDGSTTTINFNAQDGAGNQATQCTTKVTATPPNPCSSQPCLNGGTCTATGSTYSCQCPQGWTGSQDCATLSPQCSLSGSSSIGVCPLEELVEVDIGDCSPNTFHPTTFSWTATGPVGYNVGSLNTWLAQQNTRTLQINKDIMVAEGVYVFSVDASDNINHALGTFTVDKANGATPTLSLSGVPANMLRKQPLSLSGDLIFPNSSCLTPVPYQRVWSCESTTGGPCPTATAPAAFADCNNNYPSGANSTTIAQRTSACNLPPWTFQLSPSDTDSGPAHVIRVCASPIGDIAAITVCATRTITWVTPCAPTARVSGALQPEIDGYNPAPIYGPEHYYPAVTQNGLDVNQPFGVEQEYTLFSPALTTINGLIFDGFPTFPDPVLQTVPACDQTGRCYQGTVDPNNPPGQPNLLYHWECYGNAAWPEQCFNTDDDPNTRVPACCSLQAGANRLHFQNRIDQPDCWFRRRH